MSEEMKLLMALCDALGFEIRIDKYVDGKLTPPNKPVFFNPDHHPSGRPLIEERYKLTPKQEGE